MNQLNLGLTSEVKTKLTSQTAIQLPCSLLKDSNLVCNRFFAKSKSSTLQRWGSALLRTGTKVAFWFLHALKNAARKALKFWFSKSLLASASMIPHYPAKKTRKTRKIHNLVGSNHQQMTSWSTSESRNIFRSMQQNHHQPFFQGIWRHPHVLSHGLHGDQLVLNIFRRTTPLSSGRIHEDHLLRETCRLEHALREMVLSTRCTLMWRKNSTLHCVLKKVVNSVITGDFYGDE